MVCETGSDEAIHFDEAAFIYINENKDIRFKHTELLLQNQKKREGEGQQRCEVCSCCTGGFKPILTTLS